MKIVLTNEEIKTILANAIPEKTNYSMGQAEIDDCYFVAYNADNEEIENCLYVEFVWDETT